MPSVNRTEIAAARAVVSELLEFAERTPGFERLQAEAVEALGGEAAKLRFASETFRDANLTAHGGSVWMEDGKSYKLLKGSFRLKEKGQAAAFGTTEVEISDEADLSMFDRARAHALTGTGKILAHDRSTVEFESFHPPTTYLRDGAKASLNDNAGTGKRLIDEREYSAQPGRIWIPTSTKSSPWTLDRHSYSDASRLARLYRSAQQSMVQIGEISRSPWSEAKTFEGYGSGFFANPDGGIVTAYHVARKSPMLVRMNEQLFTAELADFDANEDVALIRITDPHTKNFPVLQIADSSKVNDGTKTTMFGFPNTTDALHAHPARIISDKPFYADNCLQTDGYSEPGASGGPLVENQTGEVVGVHIRAYHAAPRQTAGPSWSNRLLGVGATRIEHIKRWL